MKNLFQTALMITIFSVNVFGQDKDFSADVAKMLELNGSAKSYDLIFNQMEEQFKATMPDVPQEAWEKLKTEVFYEQIAQLNKQLIPIYQKHFTHEEVKAIIAFYQSEAGKAMAEKTPAVTQEGMVLAQQWGIGLNMAIQQYLNENGYVNNSLLNN